MLQSKLAKLLVLTDIFINEIEDDTLKMNNTTKEIHKKLHELKPVFLTILDEFYKSDNVSRTTFYNTLSDKFEYNYKREFHKYFKIKI